MNRPELTSIIADKVNTTKKQAVNPDWYKGYEQELKKPQGPVSKEVQEMADVNLCIEMNSKLESLNVSVAGGILMYMLKK